MNLHVCFSFSNLLHPTNNKSACLLLILNLLHIETINLHVTFSFSNLLHHINNESACLLVIFKFITQ